MNVLDNAVTQIIMTSGIIGDKHLKELIQSLLTRETPLELSAMFKRINARLRMLALEVRTAIQVENGERSYYHGIVNLEADAVSVEFGSHFTPQESKFFNEILNMLVEKKKMTSDEIFDIRETHKLDKWTEPAVLGLLERLLSEHWLLRDDRNFWRIGMRSHLELKALLQEILQATWEGDEGRFERERDLFPQIIMY